MEKNNDEGFDDFFGGDDDSGEKESNSSEDFFGGDDGDNNKGNNGESSFSDGFDFGTDDNKSGGGSEESNMFGGGGDDFKFASNREAYQNAFDKTNESGFTKKRSFVDSIKDFFTINKEIYEELPISLMIIIGILGLISFFLIFILKELIVYIIVYNYNLFGFMGLERLSISLVYVGLILLIFNYTDGNSKLLKTILSPIKIGLVVVSVFYIGSLINFNTLFNIGTIFSYILLMVNIFGINEFEKAGLDKIKKQIGIENDEVKAEVSNIIKQSEDTILGDLPEMGDIMTNDEGESEIYDLPSEIINKIKELQKSGIIIGEKNTLYYIDIEEESLPSLDYD